MEQSMECSCNASSFLNSMCKPCLRKIRKKLIAKIEAVEDRIDELNSELNNVDFYLGDEE